MPSRLIMTPIWTLPVAPMTGKLWQETPLIFSSPLSQKDASVYLKLETVHPGMSFKSRGISLFVQRAKETHGPSVHLVIASGGNAALAAACTARSLDVRCTVYIPAGAAQSTLDLLDRENAKVVIGGKNYAEALRAAKQVVDAEKNAVMVPAYDDPIVWEGHSSLIMEASRQMTLKPSAIFCSVGGAGLLGGIIDGCKVVGWDDVPIVTLETIGSNSFYHSMMLNRLGGNAVLPEGVTIVHDAVHDVQLAHFSTFSSKASGSLGASQPAAGVVKKALQRVGAVICVSVPDELSMQAAYSFADDHKMLVELACSTTLVAAYKSQLFDHLVPPTGENRTGLFIVCGGFKVSLNDMLEYRALVDGCSSDALEVCCDGNVLSIRK
ncbi:tryptophan synthase beta subunit-like PLP-dependent enzyme [Mycena maculata]|uniref:L-serine ammonia-lyase n=1 Tax=Mycena maculata TaxID=230809 RepID=A0AAD7I4N6_9AGAR|nr:tryptophan synthase beta subunit-like PLP-dependent enzyme [Mycena maculata]